MTQIKDQYPLCQCKQACYLSLGKHAGVGDGLGCKP